MPRKVWKRDPSRSLRTAMNAGPIQARSAGTRLQESRLAKFPYTCANLSGLTATRPRLTGAYCASRTATGSGSNNPAIANSGPLVSFAALSTFVISENPAATSDASQASPDGHWRPPPLARANRRAPTTITALRPLSRANARISLLSRPEMSSGRYEPLVNTFGSRRRRGSRHERELRSHRNDATRI